MKNASIYDLSKISGDLDTNKEHTHDIGNDDGGNASGGVGDLDAPGAVAIETQIQEHDSQPTQDEHEPGRESLDDVLAVHSPLKEHDGSYGSCGRVLDGADAGGLDDDVVDEAGDDEEVGEEDEGVDGHRGGEC